MGEKCQGLFVCCDGLPFKLCISIAQNTSACGVCYKFCLKVNEYQNHCHNKLNGEMIFLICYLAALWPTLGHYQGDSLTNFCQVLTQRSPGA